LGGRPKGGLMTGYEPPRARFRRRVAEELLLMTQRMQSVHSDCFWILSLDAPTPGESDSLKVHTSASRSRPSMLVLNNVSADGSSATYPPHELPHSGVTGYELPEPGDQEPLRSRFVQCLFGVGKPYLVLDLPHQTLGRSEAEILLREQAGFVRAADQPGIGYGPKSIKENDPVCRQYLHADVEQAAGDLAYVLFDLYALDVTTPLFQTAASFEGCACWYERGVAFETLIYPRPLGNEGCPRCRKTRRDA
ncbi:MAG: hypothetical protein O2894_13395, partial [Planctomycetota bacterium]|nr:hypothetical protein [Planctomycetota bacterium]